MPPIRPPSLQTAAANKAGQKDEVSTSFSSFLRNLRLNRGFDTITDYLKSYPLPISTAYYRDLEYGRRVLNLDTASQVCKALAAEEHSFYYHLVLDLLPPEAQKILCPPEKQESLYSNEVESTALDARAFSLPYDKFYIDSQSVALLEEHIDLLVAASLIYDNAPFGVSQFQLAAFLESNNIKLSADFVLNHLTALGIVEDNAANASAASGERLFRSGKVWLGLYGNNKLRYKWLRHQVSQAIVNAHSARTGFFAPQFKRPAFATYGLGYVKRGEIKKMLDTVLECAATLRKSRKYATEKERLNLPYFCSIILSPRPEFKI